MKHREPMGDVVGAVPSDAVPVTARVSSLWHRLHGHRRLVASLIYATITAVAYVSAYLLRFDFAVPVQYAALLRMTIIPLILVRAASFQLMRLTRGRWRYASTSDVIRLIGSCAIGTTAFLILTTAVLPLPLQVPLSILSVEALLTCVLTAGVWLSYRITFEHFRYRSGAGAKRVLIIGAGDAGNMLAREMLRSATGYVPIGFVDDNPRMGGAMVQGLEVVGGPADLQAIVERTHAEELILAVPSADPPALRKLVLACEATGLPFKVLPAIRDVISGSVNINQLREIRIEDLLGREPVQLELPELAADLRGRTVLITGAAGSIGAELSRQVALHSPQRLVLLDQAETGLFFLEMDLRRDHPDVDVVPVIADISRRTSITHVFATHRPQRVYHAAAYKHVPLMECNPEQAIDANVLGTRIVAEEAGRHGCERFVLVSTDKAVRPHSVMGASKRLAELTVLALEQVYPATGYGAVRFGNVLGSAGSVIPIFQRQIERGEPLTVTHAEATRYFMTIPEAVQLILQSSLLDEFRGGIAMLDMGEPVRIVDLARNMLRLAGRTPDVGTGIVFTGLRPGEKLHEELAAPGEAARPTAIPKVKMIRADFDAAFPILKLTDRWIQLVELGHAHQSGAELRRLLEELDETGRLVPKRSRPPQPLTVPLHTTVPHQ